MTPKAKMQIEKLQLEADVLLEQSKSLRTKSCSTTNQYEYRALKKEADQLHNKAYRREDKIQAIESIGYSTAEQSSIMKESIHFTSLEIEKSIGTRRATKVGFSKTAASLIKIELFVYTDFMRNVKGCGGLAGKKSLSSIEIITEDEMKELKSKGRRNITLFGGCHETVTPIMA